MTRIADPKGEGSRAFVKVWKDQALAAAEASDALRKAGLVPSALAGIPVSIKNLCDVAGETTLSGSKALDDAKPATADAPVVARLRAAGAVIVGSTNMSEFAFSGVGFNPHYGTPAIRPTGPACRAAPLRAPLSRSPTAWPLQRWEPTLAARCAFPPRSAA